jgi:hypothetical protein
LQDRLAESHRHTVGQDAFLARYGVRIELSGLGEQWRRLVGAARGTQVHAGASQRAREVAPALLGDAQREAVHGQGVVPVALGRFDAGGDLGCHAGGVAEVRTGVAAHGVDRVLVPAQGLSGTVEGLVRVTVLCLDHRDHAQHAGEVQREGRLRGLQPGSRVRLHGQVGVGERGSGVPGQGVCRGAACAHIADACCQLR